MTEEFVAVYRMHPLLPDDLSFRSVQDNRVVLETTFPEVAFQKTRPALERITFSNALYSFGTLHPGAITLHNFPTALQRLTDLDGVLMDHVFVGFRIPLPIVDVPAQALKERVQEFTAHLGLIVLTGAIRIPVVREAFDEVCD